MESETPPQESAIDEAEVEASGDAPESEANEAVTETAGENTGAAADAAEPAGGAPEYAPDELGESGQSAQGEPADVNLDLVLEVPVNVSLRVGSADISIRDLVTLVEGSVVALDQDAGEPMDVLVNGTLIAHGEIVIVDDQYGVRLIDVVSPVERVENLH